MDSVLAANKENRKPISLFVKRAWTNMNIRCGKYRHLGDKKKNLCYKDIAIEFSREEFKSWCLSQEDIIFSLSRPSIDRIDSTKNYCIDNIQIIELKENVNKMKDMITEEGATCSTCGIWHCLEELAKDKRTPLGRRKQCKGCDNDRGRKRSTGR